MRPFEEIREDIVHAVKRSDISSLRTLAAEMLTLGTPSSEAHAHQALGTADSLFGDYPSALEHNRRALALHTELGDSAGVAQVTGNIGNTYYATGDYQSALEHYRSALKMYEEQNDRGGAARVNLSIGNVYLGTGDFLTARDHYNRALTLNEALNDRIGIARALVNLGTVNFRTGKYPLALENYRRALTMHEELADRAGMASVNGNIGSVYADTGDYPLAIEHFRRALSVHEELGNRVGVARITGNIGSVYFNIAEYPSALEHFKRALDVHVELGDRAGSALVKGNMGNVFTRTGDHHAALDSYRQALSMFEVLEDRHGTTYYMGNLIKTLIYLGRHIEAAEMLDRQSTMQMVSPSVRATHFANRALLAEHSDDLNAAHQHLTEALAITSEAGLRSESAEYHYRLRELAQRRNDFAAYIEHNSQYQQINEEIQGKEATQRMTMMEAERRMEGERRERDKERALLYGALPKSVADRMIRGETVSGDHFDHAAVVFVDVVAFTSHTATMHPADVVSMLDHIFKTFDEICEKTRVMKVKTIGDSYMCFRGDADAWVNAQSVAAFAVHALRTSFTWPTGEPVRFRAGAHIGPATAGVIGTQRLQYDVWGDTVNVASRMESSGEAGKVHVSEAFASELKRNTEYRIQNPISESENPQSHSVSHSVSHEVSSSLVTIERGEIEVKGKGPMTTYWLEDA